jgi:hypothetical protein
LKLFNTLRLAAGWFIYRCALDIIKNTENIPVVWRKF